MSEMKYRKAQNDHDTTEQPDVLMWVNQTPVPVKVAGDWTLGTNMVATSGSLVLTASPDAEVAKRNIPGIVENHQYKVTIVLDSIDAGELDVVLGGASVVSLNSANTFVATVRPTYGNELTITVDNAASVITATISSITIEAVEPLRMEQIPVI